MPINQNVADQLEAARHALTAGEIDKAADLCRDCVRSSWQAIRATPEQLNLLAEIVFQTRNFSSISEFTAAAYGQPCEIEIAPRGSMASGPGVASWTLGGRRVMRFVFDGSLYDHPFLNVILKHWVQCLRIYAYYKSVSEDAEGTIAINLEDMGTVPGLAFCDYRLGYNLIADPIFMVTGGYQEAKAVFDGSGLKWMNRQPSAIWRGSTTGWFDVQGVTVTDWRALPRVGLCIKASNPGVRNMIDAGITSIAQIAINADKEIEALGILRPFLHWADFQHYKYQVDIDGNSASWPGLFLKLCSGSVVLKVDSPVGFKQWYYDRLIPWYNYVPVAADMSDLIEKITWLRKRDALAEAIGENGRRLASQMTPESETWLSERAIGRAFALNV